MAIVKVNLTDDDYYAIARRPAIKYRCGGSVALALQGIAHAVALHLWPLGEVRPYLPPADEVLERMIHLPTMRRPPPRRR